MRKFPPVFLCGFMGAGKTSCGRILAEKLRWEFADTDEETEKEYGIKISEIINEKGFGFFRVCERKILRKLSLRKNIIIACGGGLYPNAALENVFRRGISIFLNTAENVLCERLARCAASRPKLCTGGKEPEETIDGICRKTKKLLSRRMPYYRRCQVIFNDNGGSIERNAVELLHIISASMSVSTDRNNRTGSVK